MRVVFRVDASSEIGIGHITRCLTLARALRARGVACEFLSRTKPEDFFALTNRHRFRLISLPSLTMSTGLSNGIDCRSSHHKSSPSTSWRRDAIQSRSALEGAMIDLLIVDHYGLDQRWETLMRPLCHKIMVIDDRANRPHDCDLLLDQNLVANYRHRYENLLPDCCSLMLGPEFALLHPAYPDLRSKSVFREGSRSRVLVYFGGADKENLTGTAISALEIVDKSNISLDVVVSRKSPHFDKIRSQVRGMDQATIHSDKDTLAWLLDDVDLVVGGGGVSSWERCCLGIPAIVISLTENQIPASKELHNRGAIQYLGHKNEVNEQLLADAIGKLLNAPRSKRVFELCQSLVDGKGTERVVDRIAKETGFGISIPFNQA